MKFLALALTALTLISCNRDPAYLKQKYLESGNKYFDAGRFKEASIMYRKAIDKDRKFGAAYYKVALVNLKQNQIAAAINPLRRAVELLPPNTPDSNDAILKISEIFVVAAQGQEKNEQLVKEVQDNVARLLKQNPNGWEGQKLSGDLNMLELSTRYRAGDAVGAKKALVDALAHYRSALNAKPGDYIIMLAVSRALILNGESPEAESVLQQLMQKDKTNLSAFYDSYRLYVAQRKLPEAEAVLKTAIKNQPKDTSLRLELARFYFGTNRRDDLLALMKDMKAHLKEFPNAYLQSGDFFIRVNQFDDAVKQYEEGIQKDPQKKTTYLKHEIEAYVRQNKLDLAQAKNAEILRIDPKDPEAKGLKATFMLDKGQVTEAMADLQSVVTARPGNFVARFNLGRAHMARGELDQARQEFDKALELRPDYMPARFAQTQVALLRADNDGAIRYADEILRVSPGNVQGRVMKAAALQRQQKFADARGLLQPIIDKDPTQVEALLELGVLNLNEKKNQQAIEMFQKAYTAAPTNIRGLLGQSKALLLDGQIEKSVGLIEGESQKFPERGDLKSELGNAQLAAGQFDSAIGTFQNLMSKTKNPKQQADVWARIAQGYRYKGDMQHAVEALEKAHQASPDNGSIDTNLAMLYEEMGKSDLGRKYYEAALRVDGTNAYALNNLAYLIAESNGDLNEALTYAQRAKQKLPNFSEITDTIGWIYLKKNLPDSAIDNFKALVIQSPENPVFHFHYAMALNQKGDREGAKKECNAALLNRPSKSQEADIRKLLSKLG
jgi:tetratricopeptide (TPR) repeat protein